MSDTPTPTSCPNCKTYQAAAQEYREALTQTTRLLSYTLDPKVTEEERARIRKALKDIAAGLTEPEPDGK